MLTGRPPFESADSLELIHAHIARVPRDPRELRPEIPLPVSRVVLRLLQKQPEERYTSAALLHTDLRQLHEELARTGTIAADAVLTGLHASADRLSFGKSLHGRAAEQQRLASLFSEVAAGQGHTVLISGDAGMGKSALADALRPAISAAGGYLAAGKFDEYRARPYSA